MWRKYKLAYAFYIFINLLFVVKYSLRINVWLCVAITFAYTASVALLMNNMEKVIKLLSFKIIFIIFALYITALLIAQCSINPYHIQVDRWSAINNFIAFLLQGKYPYMAQTHLGGYGSPFPVWQIVHLPFYLLHNVGLSFFAALAWFVYCVYKYFNRNATATVLLLIITSPAVMYEVLVRSDLLTNFIVASTITIIFYKRRINLRDNFFLIAITCGLLLSTRLSAVVPLGVLLLTDWWRQGIKKKIFFPITVLIVFAFTFLPFFLWDGNDLLFFQYNPFVLQSRQTHPIDIIIISILFVYFSIAWTKHHNNIKRFSSLTANISLLLLASVMIVFAHNMILSGNYALFSSAYDITYFNMSLPFVIINSSSESCL